MDKDNKSGKIITNVIWKFAERILAQLVSFIVSVVLARLVLPDDYGAIAMVLVFINVANVFVTSGIPTSLIQKKDADKLDFSSVFYFNLVLSVILYLILFLTAPFIADFYNLEILSPVIRVLGIRLIVASVNSVQHSYVSRNMMFKKYFWSTLFGTLISGVVGIALAYKNYGVWALVAQYMTNTTVDTLVLFITVKWRPSLEFSFSRVRRLFKFGWKILFEGVSNTLANELQNFIIGKVYTKGDLAYYTKGQQFPSLIVNNITASIGSVLFPAMSDEQDNKNSVLDILRNSVRLTSYVVYPMLTGLAVVASPLISVLLTDKWIETVPFLQAFCILNAPTVGMIPRHQAINSIGRSDVFMNEHIAARIVAIIVLLLTYKISIMAIVIGCFISSGFLSLIVAFTSKKYNGYKYKDQIKDILPTLIGCLLIFGAAYPISLIGLSTILTLIVQAVTGAFVYFLYSYLFKIKEFKICAGFITGIFKKIKDR